MGLSRQEHWSGVPLPSPRPLSRDCFCRAQALEHLGSAVAAPSLQGAGSVVLAWAQLSLQDAGFTLTGDQTRVSCTCRKKCGL